jgi:uncharacterized protein YbjT (DUF2867 family)
MIGLIGFAGVEKGMYLVTGATGQLGQRIVRYLRQKGQPVRALVRFRNRYDALEHWGAEICLGDMTHAGDLQRACRGIEVIISTHSSRAADLSLIEQVDYRSNLDLIEVAEQQGIRHFVFISVLGANTLHRDAPVFRAKAAVERGLEGSSLNYTILRPSGFSSNILQVAESARQTGIYPLIGDGQHRTSIVSTDDLAHMAALAADLPAAQRAVIAVGGPQILRRDQIPTLISQLLNRDLWVLPIPLGVLDGGRSVLGVISEDLRLSLGTFRTLLAHEFFCTTEETDRLQSIFGFPLETLEAYLRRYLDLA